MGKKWLIKKCPFCGSTPRMVKWHGGGPAKVAILCRDNSCHVSPMVTGHQPHVAAERWNERNSSRKMDLLSVNLHLED
jgi:hypothetical protein